MSERRSFDPNAGRRVYDYLRTVPNLDVPASEIQVATGLPRSSVLSALNRMARGDYTDSTGFNPYPNVVSMPARGVYRLQQTGLQPAPVQQPAPQPPPVAEPVGHEPPEQQVLATQLAPPTQPALPTKIGVGQHLQLVGEVSDGVWVATANGGEVWRATRIG